MKKHWQDKLLFNDVGGAVGYTFMPVNTQLMAGHEKIVGVVGPATIGAPKKHGDGSETIKYEDVELHDYQATLQNGAVLKWAYGQSADGVYAYTHLIGMEAPPLMDVSSLSSVTKIWALGTSYRDIAPVAILRALPPEAIVPFMDGVMADKSPITAWVHNAHACRLEDDASGSAISDEAMLVWAQYAHAAAAGADQLTVDDAGNVELLHYSPDEPDLKVASAGGSFKLAAEKAAASEKAANDALLKGTGPPPLSPSGFPCPHCGDVLYWEPDWKHMMKLLVCGHSLCAVSISMPWDTPGSPDFSPK